MTDLERGSRLATAAAPEGAPLTLRYRHSLYGGTVWERLRVRGGALALEAVEAEREAAAEYYRLRGPIRRHGARFRVDAAARPLPEIVLRATRLGERTLITRHGALPLAVAAGDGHRVRITVRPLARALLWWETRTTPWMWEEASSHD